VPVVPVLEEEVVEGAKEKAWEWRWGSVSCVP
jgi:hypothetical protein